jgi:hypothetical protein
MNSLGPIFWIQKPYFPPSDPKNLGRLQSPAILTIPKSFSLLVPVLSFRSFRFLSHLLSLSRLLFILPHSPPPPPVASDQRVVDPDPPRPEIICMLGFRSVIIL